MKPRAEQIKVATEDFTQNLSDADDTVQKALESLDKTVGAQGPQGAKGDKGDKGDAGTSVDALLLDQIIPQTVVNGAPTFDKGVNSNGDIFLRAGKKIYFDA